MHVTGDQFIGTLAAYLRTNETQLFSSESNEAQYFPVLSAAHPKARENPFLIDPLHLHYLNQRLSSIPKPQHSANISRHKRPQSHSGFPPTSRPQSITSVNSQRSVISVAASLLTSWTRWSTNAISNNGSHPRMSINEDLLYIQQCLKRIAAVRLGPFGKRRILDAICDDATPILVDLSLLESLKVVDLYRLHPLTLQGWSELQQRLRKFTVKGVDLSVEGVEVVLVGCIIEDLKRKQLESEPNVLTISEEFSSSNSATTINSVPIDQQFTSLSPDEVWNSLQSLSITSASLSVISAHAFVHVASSLQFLDLSRNNLTAIPMALTDLYRLRVIELGWNEISSLVGVGEILGMVKRVGLRGNKVESLEGVERLWGLEEFDVRDNLIGQSHPASRVGSYLGGLPELKKFWVAGNPIVNEASYRLEIFAAFKKSGNLDDQFSFCIDDYGPTFMERHSLKSRPGPPQDATEIVPVADVTVAGGHHLAGDANVPIVSVSNVVAVVKSDVGSKSGVARAAVSGIANSDPLSTKVEVKRSEKPRKKKKREVRLVDIETLGRADSPIILTKLDEKSEENEVSAETNTRGAHIPVKSLFSSTDAALTSPTSENSIPSQFSPANRRVLRVQSLEESVQINGIKPDHSKEESQTRVYVKPKRTDSRESILDEIRQVNKSAGDSSTTQVKVEYINAGEEFRRRIQAMRDEAGTAWLKVYSELNDKEDKEEQEQKLKHSIIQNDLKNLSITRSATSSPLGIGYIPAARRKKWSKDDLYLKREIARRKNKRIETENSRRSLSHNLVQELNKENVDLAKLADDIRNSKEIPRTSSPEVFEQKPPETPIIEENTGTDYLNSSQSVRFQLTPNLPVFVVQVQQMNNRTVNRRRKGKPHLAPQLKHVRIDPTRLVEMDPKTHVVSATWSLHALLKVTFGKSSQSKDTPLLLEFKYSKFDPIVKVAYLATGMVKKEGVVYESSNPNMLMEKEIKAILRQNLERGWPYEVLKQARCLKCEWSGFMEQLNNLKAKETLDEENDDLEDRSCPSCNNTYMVEFYGKKTDSGLSPNEAELFLGEENLSPGSNAIGALSNMVKGTVEEGFSLIGGVVRAPAALFEFSQNLVTSKSENEDKPREIKTEKKPCRKNSIVKCPPPYQKSTNPLGLFFHLQLFSDDAEVHKLWLPCGLILQRGPIVAGSSLDSSEGSAAWSIFGVRENDAQKVANVNELQNMVPKPAYIALSSQYLYLLKLRPIKVVENHSEDHSKKDHDSSFSFGMFGGLLGGSASQESKPVLVTLSELEKYPEKHLRTLYTIPLQGIVRVDKHLDSLACTMHFEIYDIDGSVSTPVQNDNELIPQGSVTMIFGSQDTGESFISELQSALDLATMTATTDINTNCEWEQKMLLRSLNATNDFISTLHVSIVTWRYVSSTDLCSKDTTLLELGFLALMRQGEDGLLNLCSVRWDIWPPPVKDLQSFAENYANQEIWHASKSSMFIKKESVHVADIHKIIRYSYAKEQPGSPRPDANNPGYWLVFGEPSEAEKEGAVAQAWQERVVLELTASGDQESELFLELWFVKAGEVVRWLENLAVVAGGKTWISESV